ncbi:RICIN domain-containing protein [Streptomyces sp. NPDC051310]|uniref:NHL domain-containing protein n=1 Tax=Streptomyces sp. NPDC051310 TaxID=3365649 RepID=UPI0037A42829
MSTAHVAATGGEHSVPRISTVAGTGVEGCEGDNEPAVSARLNLPYGMAVDSSGTIYISEYKGHRVRKITTDGKISTVAGTGASDFGGDGGSATDAHLNGPRDVVVDSVGNLYIADGNNHRVRKVTADGKISTVAGTGTPDFGGDGGSATDAHLNTPRGVAVDSAGILYIADSDNHRVRKVTADGKISTVAGTGTPDFGGDGGFATDAHLNGPRGVAVDNVGNLYIADHANHRVRKVTAEGKISTVAGTGTEGSDGDGGPAISAQLYSPAGLVVDSTGTLYISEYNGHRVRKVTADGGISTVAGTGTADFGGDGDAAALAQLRNPLGLAVNCVDALYIADHFNHRVRKIAAAPMAGLPASGAVVSWANVRSRLRMAAARESTKDGAEIHQALTAPRDHQRWRLVVSGQDNGDVLYTIENVRSGKVLEVVGAQETAGAVVAQRAYGGDDAHHQQWRLIPVGSLTDTPRVYEIANRNSGLLLQVDTNARTVIKQYGSEGDHRGRQWQLLPV